MKWRKTSVFLCAFLLMPLSSLYAQYFGKNKVQYKSFNFKVLKTPDFKIYYYPEESTAVRISGQMLERWNGRYTHGIFNVRLPSGQPVILYANQPHFEQTNAIPGIIPQETGGVTEGLMNRVVIPLTGVFAENDHVLGHELTHAFQYSAIKKNTNNLSNVNQIPLWFIEGMAEYCSRGSHDYLTSMWMRDAVLRKDVPKISKVGMSYKYFPYRYGQAIWAYIAGRWGDPVVGTLTDAVIKDGWGAGFKSVLGVSLDSISRAWRKATTDTYTPQLTGRTVPSKTGKTVISTKALNLSPSVSPDGKYVAYLSSRGLFSIDLYLADVATGKKVKRLVSSETNPHFDALRFLNSSGSWSPDGKSFAFIVFQHGENRVAILDVEQRRIDRIFKIEGIDAIQQLAWSPDGEKLAVSGTWGSISDLYIYDLRYRRVSRLTNDLNAQIQPAWSPDGKKLAFVTDIGPFTSFDSLAFGSMRIGIIDIENGQTGYISAGEGVTHINPQFSPDGKDIYMIANPDGICDIYRYSIDEQKFYRVTRVATGISGLTELSPAMSVSSKSGLVVFNVFDGSNYRIQSLDSSQARGELFTTATRPDSLVLSNSSLPPLKPGGGIVNAYLAAPYRNLSSGESFSVNRYRPSLHLLYVGQLYAGIGADPFGISFGGGASFLFSDILGNKLVGVNAQINGDVKGIGAEVFYLDQSHRLNWGVDVAHQPFLSTFQQTGTDTIMVDSVNTPVQKVTFINQWTFEDQAMLFSQFPISTNRRIELGGGYLRIGYSNQAQIIRGSGSTILDDRTVNLRSPSALNFAQADAAFVSDFSYDGLTGPVDGRRYRIEFMPVAGSLLYANVLGDFRQYFFFKPLTLGFRALHYGRYLKDSSSDRLSPLFVGSETWIRGYSIYSFDLSQCAASSNFQECPDFNRLLGSRIAVFNSELRIPILGTDQLGLINFPIIPTDLVGFFDAGAAWNAGDYPKWKFTSNTNERTPVLSAGGAARFNLFNYLILQIYSAYPFQRQGNKWQWGFVFAPGW